MCFRPWGNYRDKCRWTTWVTGISFCLWQSKLKISGGDINTKTKTELLGQLLSMYLVHKRHTQASGLRPLAQAGYENPDSQALVLAWCTWESDDHTLSNIVISPCNKTCGPHTTSIVVTWEPIRTTSTSYHSNPLNLNLSFNKDVLCTLKFDIHWSIPFILC